ATRNYSESYYDSAGVRYERLWRLATPHTGQFPLGVEDVLLVTGGGKGIGAECAIEAARRSGAKIALLGSSEPEHNRELAGNLGRIEGLGIHCRYFRADVTDRIAVSSAVHQAEQIFGPITAILHCAGINEPRPIEALEEAAFRKTVAVKVTGL